VGLLAMAGLEEVEMAAEMEVVTEVVTDKHDDVHTRTRLRDGHSAVSSSAA